MTRNVNVIISPLVNESDNIFLNTLKKYNINIVDSDSDSKIMFIFLGKDHNLDRIDWYFLKRDYKINRSYDIESVIEYSTIYVVAIDDDGKLYFRNAITYDNSDDSIELNGFAKLFVEDLLEKEFFLKEEPSSYQLTSQKSRLLL